MVDKVILGYKFIWRPAWAETVSAPQVRGTGRAENVVLIFRAHKATLVVHGCNPSAGELKAG